MSNMLQFRPLIVCVLILIAVVGCSRNRQQAEAPNVLFISIDTLRKDHLGVYGYDRPTSPHIDQLAKKGVVFDNMISSSSWTLPAHASMLTGKYPAFHGLQDDGVKLALTIPTLAEKFVEKGYDTLGVVSHVYVSSVFGLERGFNVFDDSLIDGGARNPIAEEVVDRFLSLVDKRPLKKYFGFIHFFDPHADYTAPPPFRTKFTDPSYNGKVDGTQMSVSDYLFIDQTMPESDRQQLIAYYDGEIAYVDAQIGRLLRELEERRMLDNTVILITSDHGEEFKEHGQIGHGRTLFGEQLRVPLIIAGYQKALPGRHRKDLVSTIDLAPTLLDIVGVEDLRHFQGRPLFRRAEDGDYLTISESIRYGLEMRAVRQGLSKLIHYLEGDIRHYFELQSDPFEHRVLLEDPTQGKLQSALEAYSAIADSGWHFKLIALNKNWLRSTVTIKTSGRFVTPRHYFSKNISDAIVNFSSFELSPDKKELTFEVFVSGHMGEVVFETDPPDATITLAVKTTSKDEGSGVFLGRGVKVPDNESLTLTRSDPRVKEVPKNYLEVPTGIYIRTVSSVAESAPKSILSKEAVERLRSLGYIQ